MPGTVLGTGSYSPEKTNPPPPALLPQEAPGWGSYCPSQPCLIFRTRGTPLTPPLHWTPTLSWGWWGAGSVYSWRIDAIKKESKVLPRSQSKDQGSPKLPQWGEVSSKATRTRETYWCPHHYSSFSGSPEPSLLEPQSSQTSLAFSTTPFCCPNTLVLPW